MDTTKIKPGQIWKRNARPSDNSTTQCEFAKSNYTLEILSVTINYLDAKIIDYGALNNLSIDMTFFLGQKVHQWHKDNFLKSFYLVPTSTFKEN